MAHAGGAGSGHFGAPLFQGCQHRLLRSYLASPAQGKSWVFLPNISHYNQHEMQRHHFANLAYPPGTGVCRPCSAARDTKPGEMGGLASQLRRTRRREEAFAYPWMDYLSCLGVECVHWKLLEIDGFPFSKKRKGASDLVWQYIERQKHWLVTCSAVGHLGYESKFGCLKRPRHWSFPSVFVLHLSLLSLLSTFTCPTFLRLPVPADHSAEYVGASSDGSKLKMIERERERDNQPIGDCAYFFLTFLVFAFVDATKKAAFSHSLSIVVCSTFMCLRYLSADMHDVIAVSSLCNEEHVWAYMT